MRMRALVLLIISSSLLTTSYAAFNDCPEVSKIISVGLNAADINQWGWKAMYSPYYEYTQGTNWNFFIGAYVTNRKPGSKEEAIKMGLAALQSLKYSTRVKVGGYTNCVYRTNDREITASAVTPIYTIS